MLITPPFTQLNTPYPATAYLKGFLNTQGISSYQMDLGIEVILELFSKNGLSNLRLPKNINDYSENAQRIYALWDSYCDTIDQVIGFLQGKQPTLARQICQNNYLPEASRFSQLDELDWAFGTMGIQDKAKHLATLYLEDISDFIQECIDKNFGFSRYAESLGRSANSFDELHHHLQQQPTHIDIITLNLLDTQLSIHQPELVCITVPFPGNLYSAFRCAQFIKRKYPDIKLAMGGGFVNTELRDINEPRVFDFFDFITLDDGEAPVKILWEYINGSKKIFELKRTFTCTDGKVVYFNLSHEKDFKQHEVGTPDYSDLLLDKYISVIEVANPMHSLWSDGRWNKLTMAHGCYWGKCTFCDISLDYIKSYEPVSARLLADRIETLIAQTGETGFHFVDEAAPPALMRELAIEILKRKLKISWWTNIRFEKSFTTDLCKLLSESGCIAVSGGLEVASDRLLALIKKGVTVEQVAQVTRNFTDAGILVHAYLMYGYPTQTEQETIDSLELVRQLFEAGVIQSGFWHQFALTAHSPVGLNPEEYGIIPTYVPITFANNDIEFRDKTGIDHNKFSFGLKKALYNYMHGLCFDFKLQEWFDFKIPKTLIQPDFIENCLQKGDFRELKPGSKVIWIGGKPLISGYTKVKKGKSIPMVKLLFHEKKEILELDLPKDQAKWLTEVLASSTPSFQNTQKTVSDLKSSFEEEWTDFESFWYSKMMAEILHTKLLVL